MQIVLGLFPPLEVQGLRILHKHNTIPKFVAFDFESFEYDGERYIKEVRDKYVCFELFWDGFYL